LSVSFSNESYLLVETGLDVVFRVYTVLAIIKFYTWRLGYSISFRSISVWIDD